MVRPVVIVFLVCFLAGVCLLGGAPARADRGVAIDLGKVAVTDPLPPGGEYQGPVLGISNPGNERARYRMTVSYVTRQEVPAALLALIGGWHLLRRYQLTVATR